MAGYIFEVGLGFGFSSSNFGIYILYLIYSRINVALEWFESIDYLIVVLLNHIRCSSCYSSFHNSLYVKHAEPR